MALTKSFSSQAYQGRAGQGPQFANVLTGVTDQLGEFAQEDEDEAKTIATNEVFARIAQGEAVEDVLQTTDPALVDAASLLKFQDEHNASLSGLEVDKANIRSSDASADFNVARTAEVAPNAESARATQNAQRLASEASTELAQFNLGRAKFDVKEGERITAGVQGIDDFLISPEFQSNAEAAVDAEAERNGVADQADWLAHRDTAIEEWKAAQLTDPDFFPKLAQKNNLSQKEFETYSGQGIDFRAMKNELIAVRAAESTLDRKRNEAINKSQINFTKRKNSNLSWTDDGWSFEPAVQTVADGRHKTADGMAGLNLEDETTEEVINHLKDRFPETRAYSHVLKNIRGPGNSKTLTYGAIDTINSIYDSQQAVAKKAIRDRETGGNRGGTWRQNITNLSSAIKSNLQTGAEAEAEAAVSAVDSLPLNNTIIEQLKDGTVEAEDIAELPLTEAQKDTAIKANTAAFTKKLESAVKEIDAVPQELKNDKAVADILDKMRSIFSTGTFTRPDRNFTSRKVTEQYDKDALQEALEDFEEYMVRLKKFQDIQATNLSKETGRSTEKDALQQFFDANG